MKGGTLGLLNNILVCVTQQKTCERLIKKSVELSDKQDSIYIIHVAKDNWSILDNEKEGEALEYLFGISKSIGANLTVLRSDDIVGTIVNYCFEHKINTLIMGDTKGDHKENYFFNELKRRLPDVEIIVMPSF